jgi:L-ascorbate metabolism protein UlaG (beta-lactamase superfamily)
VALLCVGGVKSHGFEVIPLPPDEAALALDWLGAKVAVPMHYRPDSNAPQEFVAAVGDKARVCVMTPGQTVDLDGLLTLPPKSTSPLA